MRLRWPFIGDGETGRLNTKMGLVYKRERGRERERERKRERGRGRERQRQGNRKKIETE